MSVGGGLFPYSWSTEDIDSVTIGTFDSASLQSVSESFSETVRVASQQVDTERSIVVSTFEEKDQIDVTAREIQNNNDCTAVTYFVRRVYEAYEYTTKILTIHWQLFTQETLFPVTTAGASLKRGKQWRLIDDITDLGNDLQQRFKKLIALLPKPGQVVQDPTPVTVPTDGVVYEAELAHCSSCEPEKIAEAQIKLRHGKSWRKKGMSGSRSFRIRSEKKKVIT